MSKDKGASAALVFWQGRSATDAMDAAIEGRHKQDSIESPAGVGLAGDD